MKNNNWEMGIKKRKEILKIRNIKLTDLYLKERDNYEFKLASNNKSESNSYKSRRINSHRPTPDKDNSFKMRKMNNSNNENYDQVKLF